MTKKHQTPDPMNGLFHGDRPIESIGEDRLGFEESARHIARALVEMSSTEGFVIGVEGEWGSGKTSFINLVCNSFPHDSMPEIIRFSPWLISFRDVLLDELFGELSVAVSKIEGHVIESKEAKLANSMRRFAGHLSKLSKLAAVAEVLDVILPLVCVFQNSFFFRMVIIIVNNTIVIFFEFYSCFS